MPTYTHNDTLPRGWWNIARNLWCELSAIHGLGNHWGPQLALRNPESLSADLLVCLPSSPRSPGRQCGTKTQHSLPNTRSSVSPCQIKGDELVSSICTEMMTHVVGLGAALCNWASRSRAENADSLMTQRLWAFLFPREWPPEAPRGRPSPLLIFPAQQGPWVPEPLDGRRPAWVTHPHGPTREMTF